MIPGNETCRYWTSEMSMAGEHSNIKVDRKSCVGIRRELLTCWGVAEHCRHGLHSEVLKHTTSSQIPLWTHHYKDNQLTNLNLSWLTCVAASLSTASSLTITLLMSSLSLRRASMICCCRWVSCRLSAPPSEPSPPLRAPPPPPPGAPHLGLPCGTPPMNKQRTSQVNRWNDEKNSSLLWNISLSLLLVDKDKILKTGPIEKLWHNKHFTLWKY